MQVKKENLKSEILEVARQEFFLRGYEEASLRVIAKKANTSLGNIYHYYTGKEALLSEILNPFIACFEHYRNQHEDESFKITSIEELNQLIEILDQFDFDNEVFDVLLSKELVILITLKTTHYVEERERMITDSKEHIAWHLNLDKSDYLVEFVLKLFLDAFVYMIRKQISKEDRIKEFKRMFRVLCSGVIVEASETK